MPIRYPCFVSYAHAGPLLTSFREAVVQSLAPELLAYFDSSPWIDTEMVKGLGENLEEQLARAICESVCVIVLFAPVYASKPWCMRELATALRIEQERLEALSRQGLTRPSLVIPILLRGKKEDLPVSIQGKLWSDFREFSLKKPDITQDDTQYAAIRQIAEHIYEAHQCMLRAEDEGTVKWCPDDGCCKLEDAAVKHRTQVFPNRQGQVA